MPRKKKTSNPFKMWGSYIGAFIGILVHFIGDHKGDLISLFSFGSHIITGTTFAIVGFLIGWGMHSLWRRI